MKLLNNSVCFKRISIIEIDSSFLTVPFFVIHAFGEEVFDMC